MALCQFSLSVDKTVFNKETETALIIKCLRYNCEIIHYFYISKNKTQVGLELKVIMLIDIISVST
jgi:hypothetical protein